MEANVMRYVPYCELEIENFIWISMYCDESVNTYDSCSGHPFSRLDKDEITMDGKFFGCIVADNHVTRNIIDMISKKNLDDYSGTCTEDTYRSILISCLQRLTD